MRIFEVVHLVWVDSESTNDWTEVSQFTAPLGDTHSVGLLLHQDNDKYVLAVSFDPDTDSSNGTMVIPRAAVKKVKSIYSLKVRSG